ncbi:ABC transporter substrate-binding protein [Vibrio sp. NH-UV-68]|uniref:ABC transporter substrate-binding protein n=1 Tax=unclassified Vibrio TaxID=2614977 RepID=UPI0036F40EEE
MNDVNLRYLELLIKHYPSNTDCAVGLDELETALCTSRRNVSTVMRKLAQLEWINWRPAIGRSKSSQLTINKSMQQALTQVLIHELEKAHFKLIAKLLDHYGAVAVRALNIATEALNHSNEANNSVLISSYPWINTVDPVETFRLSELQVVKSVYDVLIKQDRDGHLHPALAHTWEVDTNTITLWLRPNVYRHDGELLTVDDVIWSLERLRTFSGPVQELGRCIDRISALSDHCVQITLHYPNSLFLYMLSMPNAAIACRETRSFGGRYTYHIGTGPYRIEQWNGEKLCLKAHTEYYSTGALLERVTLSHDSEVIENTLSFNQEVGEIEVESINAFSYLTFHPRKDSQISVETWHKLAEVIREQKSVYDRQSAVQGVEFHHDTDQLVSAGPLPKLEGRIVIAEPIWTIPSLIRNTKWLHRLIRSTGLELEVFIVDDISRPEMASQHADLMLIEEIIESPVEYGMYEWLSVATGLRFALTPSQMEDHQAKIREAVGKDKPLVALREIESGLYQSKTCVALFCGQEEVTKAQQVRGVQVRKSGYSDFYQLWIANNSA